MIFVVGTIAIIGWIAFVVALLSMHIRSEVAPRDRVELTEADRNLLRRHIRVLEENTKSNKRGRP